MESYNFLLSSLKFNVGVIQIRDVPFLYNILSACDTKFCHGDFVLKYIVIGGERTFSKNRDFFGSYSEVDQDLLSLFAPKCRIA